MQPYEGWEKYFVPFGFLHHVNFSGLNKEFYLNLDVKRGTKLALKVVFKVSLNIWMIYSGITMYV